MLKNPESSLESSLNPEYEKLKKNVDEEAKQNPLAIENCSKQIATLLPLVPQNKNTHDGLVQVQNNIENLEQIKTIEKADRLDKAVKEKPHQTGIETEGDKEWVVPSVLYNDERITQILHQLSKRVDSNIVVKPLDSSAITSSHSGRVLLPCIAASRIGSDLQAAVEKAKIGK